MRKSAKNVKVRKTRVRLSNLTCASSPLIIATLNFQQFITTIGSVLFVTLVLGYALCILPHDPALGYLASTIFMVSGISTLLQSTLGIRWVLCSKSRHHTFQFTDCPSYRAPVSLISRAFSACLIYGLVLQKLIYSQWGPKTELLNGRVGCRKFKALLFQWPAYKSSLDFRVAFCPRHVQIIMRVYFRGVWFYFKPYFSTNDCFHDFSSRVDGDERGYENRLWQLVSNYCVSGYLGLRLDFPNYCNFQHDYYCRGFFANFAKCEDTDAVVYHQQGMVCFVVERISSFSHHTCDVSHLLRLLSFDSFWGVWGASFGQNWAQCWLVSCCVSL